MEIPTQAMRLADTGFDVKRYHTACIIGQQTVGDHSARVAGLCLYLDEDCSVALLANALYHDVAEAAIGDLPHGLKEAHPELKEMLKECENKLLEMAGLELPELTQNERECLRAADMLEAALFGMTQAGLGNKYGYEIIKNALQALHGTSVPVKALAMARSLETFIIESGQAEAQEPSDEEATH